MLPSIFALFLDGEATLQPSLAEAFISSVTYWYLLRDFYIYIFFHFPLHSAFGMFFFHVLIIFRTGSSQVEAVQFSKSCWHMIILIPASFDIFNCHPNTEWYCDDRVFMHCLKAYEVNITFSLL